MGVDPAKMRARDFRRAVSLSSAGGLPGARPARINILSSSIVDNFGVQRTALALGTRNSLARSQNLISASTSLVTGTVTTFCIGVPLICFYLHSTSSARSSYNSSGTVEEETTGFTLHWGARHVSTMKYRQ